ncbi:MAG: hypothetical protein J6X25_05660 [Bacteroidales bacterium]|nr:hypothetical protein [Bacteroidales bacterium]
MKRLILAFLPFTLLISLSSCDKPAGGGEVTYRNVQVELVSNLATVNSAGDVVYNFLDAPSVDFSTDAGDSGSAAMSQESPNTMSGSVNGIKSTAKTLWCFTPGLGGPTTTVSVSATLPKTDPETSASFMGMAFCSSPMSLSKTNVSGLIKPLTSAVVLDIFDSKGRTWPAITTVTMASADGSVLATGSTSITFNCSNITVGKADNPASLGAVVLPCTFTGTVTVAGEGYSAVYTIGTEMALQAGYVKHIDVNLARASVNGEEPKGFPTRLGIMGDSISTFSGIIPSDHRAYYPKSDCDVNDWKKTYWGVLATQYWKCELDVNTSWSGSCVAADPRTGSSYRKPFVDRVELFQDPDAIILFGGTNDAISTNQVGLGEFNYDQPLDQMDTYCRFRDAYIFVVRSLQKNYPAAQIICIIGTDVPGDYGASVETIAKHYNLPYVDFRGEKNVAGKVTIYSGSHPDAAGHAYKARKIYEETLSLFQ